MRYARPLCLIALVICVGLLLQACAAVSLASATANGVGTVVGTGVGAGKAVGRTVF
jgi:hypothetical protein